jgi:hypothetical protein
MCGIDGIILRHGPPFDSPKSVAYKDSGMFACFTVKSELGTGTPYGTPYVATGR